MPGFEPVSTGIRSDIIPSDHPGNFVNMMFSPTLIYNKKNKLIYKMEVIKYVKYIDLRKLGGCPSGYEINFEKIKKKCRVRILSKTKKMFDQVHDEFSLELDEFFFEFLHAKEEESFKEKSSEVYDFSGYLVKDTISICLLHSKAFKQFNNLSKHFSKNKNVSFEDSLDMIDRHLVGTNDNLLKRIQQIAKDLMMRKINSNEAFDLLEKLPIISCIFPLTSEIFRQIKNKGVTRIRQRETDDEF